MLRRSVCFVCHCINQRQQDNEPNIEKNRDRNNESSDSKSKRGMLLTEETDHAF